MKGQGNIVTLFVGLTIAVILVATVVIPQVVSTNPDTFNNLTSTPQLGTISNLMPMLLAMLPLVVIVGILLVIFGGNFGDDEGESSGDSGYRPMKSKGVRKNVRKKDYSQEENSN